MNTLLLDRAQSSVHLAHPTSSYPATNGWALNLNRKFHNEKCFHMFPLKPLAHISVHPFEETLPPIQAREFGHRQALLMLCRWSIMPQSESLHTLYNIGLAKKQYKVLLLNCFLTKQPGDISMAVAVQSLVPSGHGTHSCTTLGLVMVFSVMFFTKTEPGWHCPHPIPSLRA